MLPPVEYGLVTLSVSVDMGPWYAAVHGLRDGVLPTGTLIRALDCHLPTNTIVDAR